MAGARPKTLIWFGALSLALHVLVLVSLMRHSTPLPSRLGDALSRDGEITIALTTRAQPLPKRNAAPDTDSSSAQPRSGRVHESAQTRPARDAGHDKVATAAAVLGEVRSRLARYLAYPALARARGWEGTVLVGFRLALDGQLEAVRVARSSGYDILDASALDSLGKVGRIHDVAGTSAAHSQQLELAVMYRLAPP
jgi:protein TonB